MIDILHVRLLEIELMRQPMLLKPAHAVQSEEKLVVDILSEIQPMSLDEIFSAHYETFSYEEVQLALARLKIQGKIT